MMMMMIMMRISFYRPVLLLLQLPLLQDITWKKYIEKPLLVYLPDNLQFDQCVCVLSSPSSLLMRVCVYATPPYRGFSLVSSYSRCVQYTVLYRRERKKEKEEEEEEEKTE